MNVEQTIFDAIGSIERGEGYSFMEMHTFNLIRDLGGNPNVMQNSALRPGGLLLYIQLLWMRQQLQTNNQGN